MSCHAPTCGGVQLPSVICTVFWYACQALRELLDHPLGWSVTPLGPLVTHERECETLARVAQVGGRAPGNVEGCGCCQLTT